MTVPIQGATGRSKGFPVARKVTKVSAFAVVALTLMAWLAFHISNIRLFGPRYEYQAQLTDASGVHPGNDVKMAGIVVGKVDGVALQGGHALVTFETFRDLGLHTTTDVGTRWRDVLGSEDLQLYPGTAGDPMKPGTTIPLSHDVSDASIGRFLNSLGPFLGAIDPQQANSFIRSVLGAIQGDDDRIRGLIDNAASISSTLGALSSEVGPLVDNVSTVISALASKDGDINAVIDNVGTIAQSLVDRNTLLEGVVTNLSTATQEFGQLVSTNQVDLSDAIRNLNAVLAQLAHDKESLNSGLATLGSGLAPYTEISSYGQWFQIRTVYSCMANESSCTYFNGSPSTEPAGTPPFIPEGSPAGLGNQLPGESGSPMSGPGPVSPTGAPSLLSMYRSLSGAGR